MTDSLQWIESLYNNKNPIIQEKNEKNEYIGLIFFTAVLLTACSGKTTVTQSAESELVESHVSSSQNETWGPGDRENEQPLADMLEKNVRPVGAQTELIVGICQLENTDLAINAEQATQLIPFLYGTPCFL